ncbi:hypothetical protein GJ744_008865 [Endocarpon pusillum]|uniref:Myb-like DNA-binding domain-containing protein n=1 Tax=Endocarpon pusillum TaxID=364733 RepID=A0A8H7AUT0_9EURO|nr:hypothetical protein GJ744_008865 [Endocarpon pusillum]
MAPQFNDADFAVLVSCLKNSSTKLTPDFDKVAQECGLKSRMAAYHRHWAMMKKLGLVGTRRAAAEAKMDSSAAATKPTKKRTFIKTEESEDGDVDGDEVDGEASEEMETPSKKAKTRA